MGSFSFTCSISGIGINEGAKLRYLLLTQNPYDDANVCYPHGVWFPRTFPLRGTYADYGQVALLTKGPEVDLWMAGLQLDMVEKGWGDNGVHDVPTSKDMGFEKLQEALWEGRVFVERTKGFKLAEPLNKDDLDKHVPEGVPTLRRVEKLFKKKKLTMYEGSSGDGYSVESQGYGMLRVYWRGYGATPKGRLAKLKAAQKLLAEYATLIAAGSGSYSSGPELLVRVPPEMDRVVSVPNEEPVPLRVARVMIHEEVWQALLRMKLESYTGKLMTFESYCASARAFWEACLPASTSSSVAGLSLLMLADTEPFRNNPIAGLCSREEVPFAIGYSTHWGLMLERHLANPLTSTELTAWLETVAETCFVQHLLYSIRYWWRPSYSLGPQYDDFQVSVGFYKALAAITKQLRGEYLRESA